jgi:hypothetical protein
VLGVETVSCTVRVHRFLGIFLWGGVKRKVLKLATDLHRVSSLRRMELYIPPFPPHVLLTCLIKCMHRYDYVLQSQFYQFCIDGSIVVNAVLYRGAAKLSSFTVCHLTEQLWRTAFR